MNRIITGDAALWQGCYDAGWHGEIVPEAFVHPAKVSRTLIRRIYAHAFIEGWLVPVDTVIDPFAGIAGTALDAIWNGLAWVGVELEPRFVALAQQNLDLWQRKYGSKDGFGSARILQGDSRQLANIIQSAECVISSPPYAETINSKSNGIDWAKTNRPDRLLPSADRLSPGADSGLNYGNTLGNLGAMPEGKFVAVVSSPPFLATKGGCKPRMGGTIDAEMMARHNATADERYGSETGQLSAMQDGRFDAVLSSPPYETGGHHDHQMDSWNANEGGHGTKKAEAGYGQSDGQLGGDTFWQAASEIVAQCHAILKPSGHAIWICKDFVRKGKRVPFSDQWQALCESFGFRLVCRHRAMLVANHGEQDGLFGGTKQIKTERKSFFRRLAEKKGSPPIDWEDVLCLVRL